MTLHIKTRLCLCGACVPWRHTNGYHVTGRIRPDLGQKEWRVLPHPPLLVFLPARWAVTLEMHCLLAGGWGDVTLTVLSRWNLDTCLSILSSHWLISTQGLCWCFYSIVARCKVLFVGLVQSFNHYSAVSQRLVSLNLSTICIIIFFFPSSCHIKYLASGAIGKMKSGLLCSYLSDSCLVPFDS